MSIDTIIPPYIMPIMKKYSPDKKFEKMTAKQVRDFDSWAINTLKIPGAILMENAGRSCAELIMEKLKTIKKPRVSVFCGTGNNGGDGYVIARHLLNNSCDITVIIVGKPEKITSDAKINLEILKRMGRKIHVLNMQQQDIAHQVSYFAKNCNMIVDAIFGTGLKGKLRQEYIELIDAINEQKKPVLAVDIPSGLDCDTGEIRGSAVKADYTVTFVALKTGFTSPAAKSYTGQIYIASIGIENDETIRK